jgi:hypothetical protein
MLIMRAWCSVEREHSFLDERVRERYYFGITVRTFGGRRIFSAKADALDIDGHLLRAGRELHEKWWEIIVPVVEIRRERAEVKEAATAERIVIVRVKTLTPLLSSLSSEAKRSNTPDCKG